MSRLNVGLVHCDRTRLTELRILVFRRLFGVHIPNLFDPSIEGDVQISSGSLVVPARCLTDLPFGEVRGDANPPPPYKNMRVFLFICVFLFFACSYFLDLGVQCSQRPLFAEIWQS